MSIKTTVRIEVVPDNDPDVSYLEQEGFEARRAEYRADAFSFVGVRVAVETHDTDSGVSTRTQTAGLWGIESDSGEDYFREVAAEEASTLQGVDVSGAPIVWRA